MSRYSDTLTYAAILDEMLAQVPDTVDKREGSIIYDALAPSAMELAQMYILLDVILDETFVDTASLQYLMKRADELGVPIQEATQATVRGSFTPTSLEVPEGSRFNYETVNYVVDKKLSSGVYQLICETVGSVGNIESGTLLPIDSIPGLQTAELAGVITPAKDADSAESLRKRYFEYVRNWAYGGNVADYKRKVGELPGVGAVRVIPVWEGSGTVKVQFITPEGNDWLPPDQELVAQVQEAVDPVDHHGEGYGIAPIGHTVTVEGVVGVPISVSCTITFETGSTHTTEETVKNALEPYLLELRKEWADQGVIVVRKSGIERSILDQPDVLDVEDVTINDESGNLQLASGEVPVMPEDEDEDEGNEEESET